MLSLALVSLTSGFITVLGRMYLPQIPRGVSALLGAAYAAALLVSWKLALVYAPAGAFAAIIATVWAENLAAKQAPRR